MFEPSGYINRASRMNYEFILFLHTENSSFTFDSDWLCVCCCDNYIASMGENVL